MTTPREHADVGLRIKPTTALCLLKELVAALDETHWSSWQSTARFDNQLNCARNFLAEQEETHD